MLKTLSIGKAAAFAIANWERLTRFADNVLIPLDNNGTERAIRGPVVGRKNHYGSRSRRDTEVAAILYKLVETAKLHAVDPAKYLLEAVRAADHGETLFPWQMPSAVWTGVPLLPAPETPARVTTGHGEELLYNSRVQLDLTHEVETLTLITPSMLSAMSPS